MDSIEITTKHLSDNLNIKIEMTNDTYPSTNGKIIKIPKNMDKKYLLETLGAILHESGHVRYTHYDGCGFSSEYNSSDKFDCLNVLEDIRVDKKISKIYPQSKFFRHKSIRYALEKYKDLIKMESLSQKILKHLILIANDYKPYDKVAMIAIKQWDLERFIPATYKKRNMATLIPLAKELHEILKMKIKDVLDKYLPDKSQEKTKIDTKDITDELDKAIAEEYNNQDKSMEEAAKSLKDLTDKTDEAAKDSNKKYNDMNGLRYNLESEECTAIQLQDKIEKLEERIEIGIEEDNKKEISELEVKLSKIRANIQDVSNRYEQASDVHSKASNDLINIDRKKQAATRKLKDYRLADDTSKPLGVIPYVDISSLASLGDIGQSTTELNNQLKDAIKEFFQNRTEQSCIDEQGYSLNNKNLYRLFTDSERLFKNYTIEQKKTRVSFIIDKSGSMDGVRKGNLLSAFGIVYNNIMDAVKDDNLNLDVAVYFFDTRLKKIKSFDDERSMEYIAHRYETDGGTNLRSAIRQVCDEMDDGTDCENSLIVMTDAQISPHEISTIVTNPPRFKTVYIGINVKIDRRNKILFEDNNIETRQDALNVITRAFLKILRGR